MTIMKVQNLIFSLLLFSFQSAFAQSELIKYYNQNWLEVVSVDSAFYKTTFKRTDTMFSGKTTLVKSNTLHMEGFYKTADLKNPAPGSIIQYYEDGTMQDSVYLNHNSEFESRHVYYPSGKLWAIYRAKTKQQKEEVTGFNEKGVQIRGFVYEKEATFPGGLQKWGAYIASAKYKFDKTTPAGTYKVLVKFIVNKSGAITDVGALTNFGYGLEEMVINVIQKAPRWNSAILLNRPVNAYRIQPVTLVVPENRRSRKR